MPDWEIVRIVEDVHASDSPRWLVVYRVPTTVSPDGIYSVSMPKGLLNSFAAAYEYDIDNPREVDDLFDHVMSAPMFKLLPASLTTEADLTPLTDSAFTHDPLDVKRAVKARIIELKAGAGRLKPADRVELDIAGMPSAVNGSENPKYIIKRDMVAQLDKERIDRTRRAHRQERERIMRRKAAEER